MLTSTLVLGGDVSDYTRTVQLQLRTDVANNAGVSIGDVQLAITSGSVTVTFRIAYPDATAAATGIAFFSQPVSSISSALSGVTVTSASIASLTSVTVEAPSPPPPASPPPPFESAAFGDIAVVVALAVVGVVAACACTSFYLLRRRRQRAEAERKANDLEAAEAASAAEAARIAAAPTQLRLRIRRQREMQRAEEERNASERKAIEESADAAVVSSELWRELGDVLISINGAEPSVEELHAALQSHGGSLESLATYARTDRSALAEELKRLGFSKIDLRKKVEQALAEMPKAPSLAEDLQAGAPEAAVPSHGTPVPTVRSFGRKLDQKSKSFWELQHKSEPFGELHQIYGGSSPPKASTSAAASDSSPVSTPAPARKPQSPSGSPSYPLDNETPTMTPVSLRSDLFKWLQNEELMDDLKEPEEPGLTSKDSKPASSLSTHSRTDNAVSPRGGRSVAFQGAIDAPVDMSSATELGRGQSFERVSRGSSKLSISSSKLSFKRTARLSKEVVKSLSFKRPSRKPSNKETIERAASMRV